MATVSGTAWRKRGAWTLTGRASRTSLCIRSGRGGRPRHVDGDRSDTYEVLSMATPAPRRVALIEAGSPGLNIYSHVAMGRGVALLGTVLRDAGYETRVFIEDVSGKDSIDWDFVAASDVVGFSAITCTLPRTAELIANTRTVAPHATVVMGGPEPTCAPVRSLSIGADYVLRGEAEVTLPMFLRSLLGPVTAPLHAVPGLVWVEGGELRAGTPPVQLVRAPLDALPQLDRPLIHHG